MEAMKAPIEPSAELAIGLISRLGSNETFCNTIKSRVSGTFIQRLAFADLSESRSVILDPSKKAAWRRPLPGELAYSGVMN